MVRAIRALALAYALGCIALVLLGPRFELVWPIETLNALRLLWLSPVWLLLPLAAWLRSPGVGLLGAAAALLWLHSFAGLWTTTASADASAGAELRVMTYNVHKWAGDAEAVMAIVERADADLVGFQELDEEMAATLDRLAAERYPHRDLSLENGVLSRYPLRARPDVLRPEWHELSAPAVYELEIDGVSVTWINSHQIAPIRVENHRSTRAILEQRRRQAEALAEVAHAEQAAGRAVLLTTDLNATDTSRTYARVADPLVDAWREAGGGLGLSWRRPIPGIPPRRVEGWLARIDYVFHSPHWLARAVRLGSWDGFSDHRPVIADLVWRGEPEGAESGP